MKLWLDDVRLPPEGWVWAKSYDEAVEILSNLDEELTDASLDHDLAFAGMTFEQMDALPQAVYMKGLAEAEKNGNHVIMWMYMHNVWPTKTITVHTANGPASARMMGNIRQYGPAHYAGRMFYNGEST
jgi:hypothetical protein